MQFLKNMAAIFLVLGSYLIFYTLLCRIQRSRLQSIDRSN